MPQKIPALHSCCRFDVRALLDFYKEPDPRVLAMRQKSSEELKLEQVGQLAQCCGDCFGQTVMHLGVVYGVAQSGHQVRVAQQVCQCRVASVSEQCTP